MPSSTPTPTPTPTTTLAPVPVKPTLADLVATTQGLGPLAVGAAPPVTDPALDVLVFDPVGCPPSEGPVPGIWVTSYPDVPDPFGKSRPPFQVAVDPSGNVSRIDVWSPQIKTDRGVVVGSSRDIVTSAYPDAELTEFENRSSVFTVRGTTGKLSIEVLNRPGDPLTERVVSIRVDRPTGPSYAISNTDNIISPCSFR